MFQIKICGVTRPADAVVAVRSGADAIGLNFYPPSPRSVSLEQAAAITAMLPQGNVAIVGVFVNESVDHMRSVAETVGLTAIQLHGDESPEIASALSPWPVIRAFRMSPGDEVAILEYVQTCENEHKVPLAAILVDAAVPGEFGGTGEKADWRQVAGLVKALRRLGHRAPRIVLAGGLTAANVSQAVTISQTDGVDTASGVESSPGVKDKRQIEGFVTAASAALRRIEKA